MGSTKAYCADPGWLWSAYRCRSLCRVVRALYSWGIERGFAKDNPAIHVSRISSADTVRTVGAVGVGFGSQMRPEIRIACNLGYCTGQRPGDVLEMQLGHIKGDGSMWFSQKLENTCTYLHHRDLAGTLEECRKRRSIYLVSKGTGEPFTVDQFHAMWGRTIAHNPFAPIKQAGFCFHGLRKNAVVALLEAGCTPKGGWRDHWSDHAGG